MSNEESLSFDAEAAAYEQQAERLFEELQSGNEPAQWRFKWLHPAFRGKSVALVKAATLCLADAQIVIAREYAFDTWPDLVAFIEALKRDHAVLQFETAVEAIISGDIDSLSNMLVQNPALVRARSMRKHHATLLHYIAANGVEGGRQKTPSNAVKIARRLLSAGAEADALADMYDQQCTTMSMLVSSCHPAKAGLQAQLAEVLLDHGASFEGPGSRWQSALMTALAFGYLGTAKTLAERGAPVTNLAAAAGLGGVAQTSQLLHAADVESRQIALALAAQHGHLEIVRLLLDAGEDPNRYNPEGFHSHSTPLHQAICAGQIEVVKLLVDRGADIEIRDTLHEGTALGWAIHCDQPLIAEYLRQRKRAEPESGPCTI